MSETNTTNGAVAAATAVAGDAPKHVSKFAQKQAKKGPKGGNKPNKNKEVDEPYVVIIKNAENDFSRIHTEALPVFLHLNNAKALGAAPGESKAPYKQNSNFVVKVRTETRSAEVCFYGEENASLFKSLAPKPAPTDDKTAASANGKKSSTKLADDDDDDEDDQAAAVGALSSVRDMVEVVRPRPYYQQPLTYTLETSAILGSDGKEHKGGKRARDEDETAAEDLSGHTLGSLQVVEMTNGSKQDRLVSTQMQLNTFLPIKEVRQVLKDVPGLISVWFLHKGTIASSGSSRHLDGTAPSEEASDKAAMMAGGAGGSAVYRAVFADEDALFSAKELLEQFEVSEGIRALIKLSDGYQRKYDERRREEVPLDEDLI